MVYVSAAYYYYEQYIKVLYELPVVFCIYSIQIWDQEIISLPRCMLSVTLILLLWCFAKRYK